MSIAAGSVPVNRTGPTIVVLRTYPMDGLLLSIAQRVKWSENSAPVARERTHTSRPGSSSPPTLQIRKKLSRKDDVGASHLPQAKAKSGTPAVVEDRSASKPSGHSR